MGKSKKGKMAEVFDIEVSAIEAQEQENLYDNIDKPLPDLELDELELDETGEGDEPEAEVEPEAEPEADADNDSYEYPEDMKEYERVGFQAFDAFMKQDSQRVTKKLTNKTHTVRTADPNKLILWNDKSFKAFVEKKPDYAFILDTAREGQGAYSPVMMEPLVASLQAIGYMASQPVSTLRIKGVGDVVIDGARRTRAAQMAGLKSIPYVRYTNRSDAVRVKAASNTGSEKASLSEQVQRLEALVDTDMSATQIAAALGYRMRENGQPSSTFWLIFRVARYASEAVKESLYSGKISVKEAANIVRGASKGEAFADEETQSVRLEQLIARKEAPRKPKKSDETGKKTGDNDNNETGNASNGKKTGDNDNNETGNATNNNGSDTNNNGDGKKTGDGTDNDEVRGGTHVETSVPEGMIRIQGLPESSLLRYTEHEDNGFAMVAALLVNHDVNRDSMMAFLEKEANNDSWMPLIAFYRGIQFADQKKYPVLAQTLSIITEKLAKKGKSKGKKGGRRIKVRPSKK